MKNVLVLMHDDTGQEARFQAALDLTRALNGHLTCIDVSIVPAFVGAYADMGGTALLMEDEQQREKQNRARMQARLKGEDVSYSWLDENGFLTPCVRDAAGLADVVVLNLEFTKVDYPDMHELVGEILVKDRKPIVAVPETARSFDVFGHALVAWDGSRQAEDALRAAVPLLQHASRVTILEVEDGSVKIGAEAAAEYLSRHDIKPEIVRTPVSSSAGETVLDKIKTLGVSWLVMGGFGHSRFIEATFGGVTRRMLKECPVPLFLAH